MEHAAFDAFVRAVSQGTTRRRAGRLLGGGVVGALATLRAASAGQESVARKKPKKCIPNTRAFTAPTRFCTNSQQCCGKGSCCLFEGEGKRACVNLSNNASFCGTTCKKQENCINVNFNNPACVDGECLLPLT